MRQLHRPETIFSLRHLPSWMLLTASAGMVNVIAFLGTERFVTHVTGTVTRIGIDLGSFWLAVDFVTVLVCFILGSMAASCVLDGRAHRGKPPLYPLPLFVTATLVAGAAFGGKLGWFGRFGGSVDQPADFVLLATLSFAMGIQNGAVATSTGLLVRTTHLTGPATDLGLGLAELLFAPEDRRRLAKRHAALRAGKIVSFVLGAAIAVPLCRTFEYGAFLVPAMAIAIANIVSFVGNRVDVPDHALRAHR
ncbi:MAG: YoaK family protein [Polyangiaceae bacterium]